MIISHSLKRWVSKQKFVFWSAWFQLQSTMVGTKPACSRRNQIPTTTASILSPVLAYFLFSYFLRLSCYVAWAGLKLPAILLPQPPESWDYKHTPGSRDLPILTRISRPSSASLASNKPWISRLHFITTVMMFFSCFRSTFHRASNASPVRETLGALVLPWTSVHFAWTLHKCVLLQTFLNPVLGHSPLRCLLCNRAGTSVLPSYPSRLSQLPYLQILGCLLQKSALLKKKERKVKSHWVL